MSPADGPKEALASEFSAIVRSWELARDSAVPIRRSVFVVEQGVPEALEWDEFDQPGLHVLVFDGTAGAIGTARLSPRGGGSSYFNRLAVLKPWRGRGAGRLLMQTLLVEARRRRQSNLVLHAQTGATGFYEKFGFITEGAPFFEAGIEHLTMRRSLLVPA